MSSHGATLANASVLGEARQRIDSAEKDVASAKAKVVSDPLKAYSAANSAEQSAQQAEDALAHIVDPDVRREADRAILPRAASVKRQAGRVKRAVQSKIVSGGGENALRGGSLSGMGCACAPGLRGMSGMNGFGSLRNVGDFVAGQLAPVLPAPVVGASGMSGLGAFGFLGSEQLPLPVRLALGVGIAYVGYKVMFGSKY